MEKNRLQQELDKLNQDEVINLTDTNFHRNGYKFPEMLLKQFANEYISMRNYDPHSKGDIQARESISKFYSKQGIHIGSDNIILTASSSESYSLLFNNLSETGDNIILPEPTYPLFEFIADFNKLETRFYKMNPNKSWDIDIDSIQKAIDNRTAFIMLISPNNPTGQVIPEETINAILNICSNRDIMLISDEVFSEFIYEKPDHQSNGNLLQHYPPCPSAIDSYVTVFTINGISKMFACPDLKLSWIGVTGNDSKIKPIIDKLEISNDVFLNCNAMSQYILPKLFRQGKTFQKKMIKSIDKCRRLMIDMLSSTDKISFIPPSSGIHSVLKINSIGNEKVSNLQSYDDEDFAIDLLKSKKVYLHPGYFYGLNDGIFAVISFLKDETSLRIGLERLIDFVENG
jgi:aspartate/methionine/tyrosine aminotransferase